MWSVSFIEGPVVTRQKISRTINADKDTIKTEDRQRSEDRGQETEDRQRRRKTNPAPSVF
jgi:hypothetical protein